jgi:hypothetical protein
MKKSSYLLQKIWESDRSDTVMSGRCMFDRKLDNTQNGMLFTHINTINTNTSIYIGFLVP